MLTLAKPTAESLRLFLAHQINLPFTYSEIGATAHEPPVGYVVDRTRVKLGEGEEAFRQAKAALERWDHFSLGWVEIGLPKPPIKAGEVVAVIARTAGLWWTNACRIVYEVDITVSVRQFGFAYGTLPGHAESGEERFMVEWDRSDDGVWYDIIAFSRPNHWLTRIAYPIARRVQTKFARDSAAAMKRAVVAGTFLAP